MPLPRDVWESCRRFVRPDESIRYLFPGTASIMGGGVFNVLVMVTDHAVTVLTCTLLSRFRPDAVWGRYPRAIELGPVDFSLGPMITIGGLHVETSEEYVAVIRAADAEIRPEDLLPPDPLPDL
ncbi:MAG: hypothetical protein GEV11_04290 [Streptosporangiales bacterium]|nr:hypothetical protein [Streptosporangiales bacterium]